MSIQPEHPQIPIYKGDLPIKLRDEKVSDGADFERSDVGNACGHSIYKGQNDYDRLAELKLSN